MSAVLSWNNFSVDLDLPSVSFSYCNFKDREYMGS